MNYPLFIYTLICGVYKIQWRHQFRMNYPLFIYTLICVVYTRLNRDINLE